MTGIWRKVVLLARMVKIEHSVFALPFAYLGMVWASGGRPGWRIFLVLTAAMVAVRSFAMAVNRLADLRFDVVNPRTSNRPLVTGELGRRETGVFIASCALIFVVLCALLNPLCLALSPLALIWAALYSFTKRFTPLCHFFLGSVLGLAPVGAWMAVTASLTLPAVLLGVGVTLWVGGFDILYACQDVDFDRREGLYSLPAHLGLPGALAIAAFSHTIAGLMFVLAGWAAGAGWIYAGVALVVWAILLWEHRLISPDDLSRVDVAFFNVNGFVAVFLFTGALLDTFLS
jgi:4-hydroxybenzoate polyprenyltransferase